MYLRGEHEERKKANARTEKDGSSGAFLSHQVNRRAAVNPAKESELREQPGKD
jgi:hypothetical protein